MKKASLITILILVNISVFVLGFNYKTDPEPNQYYQVYLDEKLIGTINSSQALKNYIDKQGSYLKKKYGVDTIHAPNGVEIKKITTYNKKVDKIEDVYEKIIKEKPFTVRGYQFTMRYDKKITRLYVIRPEIFDNAIKETIRTYVGTEEFNRFIDKNQEKITTTGKNIENVYIENNITIKDVNISVEEKIYTDVADLAQYLLFGENHESKTYKVKLGDTIQKIAFEHKISVEEFLISNPDFTDATNLLYPGQKVVIGIPDPQVRVVVQEYVVEDIVNKYQTEEIRDEEMYIGDEKVIQKGESGMDRISQKVKSVNGVIVVVEREKIEQLKAPVNKIVKVGGKYVPSVGSVSNWAWPTARGWILTDDYGWRIDPIDGSRKLHNGIDIAGTGYGSPIYASTNGVVEVAVHSNTGYGNHIIINHNNGYYSLYAHMSKLLVSEGQVVERGRKIGKMGSTGYSTGTHLHFEVFKGTMWNRINPFSNVLMKVSVLASGSKGNCTYIETGMHHILVDLGTSSLYAEKALKDFGVNPKLIDSIFITHTHVDHVSGLKVFLKKHNPTVYLSEKMYNELRTDLVIPNYVILDNVEILDDLKVTVFKLSHDTDDSNGYIFENEDKKLAYITDTGYINIKNHKKLKNCNLYVMESNHDVAKLMDGAYPYHLKQRILGDRGHLSNIDSAHYLSLFAGDKTKCVILIHLSEDNNNEELALGTLKETLVNEERKIENIMISRQHEKTELVEV